MFYDSVFNEFIKSTNLATLDIESRVNWNWSISRIIYGVFRRKQGTTAYIFQDTGTEFLFLSIFSLPISYDASAVHDMSNLSCICTSAPSRTHQVTHRLQQQHRRPRLFPPTPTVVLPPATSRARGRCMKSAEAARMEPDNLASPFLASRRRTYPRAGILQRARSAASKRNRYVPHLLIGGL